MNSMLTFDQAAVESHLNRLTIEKQVIFAASCATRLFSGYLRFNKATGFGDPIRLQHALGAAWRWVQGRGPEDLPEIAADIQPLLLDEDTPFTPFNAAAEDAASAVTYVLDTILNRRPNAAFYAAAVSYEATGQEALRLLRAGGHEPNSNAILRDPLVQAELSRQVRDIQELQGLPDTHLANAAIKFQKRAESENAFATKSCGPARECGSSTT